MSALFVALYSLLLLGIPSLFAVALAFSLPLDLAKEPKRLDDRAAFVLLSVLLGVTFFQFLLWHLRPGSFEGVRAILFDVGLAAVVGAVWLYAFRLVFRQRTTEDWKQRFMPLALALSALVMDTRTAILVGHWAEETGGRGSLFVNVIGIISFVVVMGLVYRLSRSARRARALQESVQVR